MKREHEVSLPHTTSPQYPKGRSKGAEQKKYTQLESKPGNRPAPGSGSWGKQEGNPAMMVETESKNGAGSLAVVLLGKQPSNSPKGKYGFVSV